MQSAEGAWAITVPYGLRYDGLKPVPFTDFEIFEPSWACIQSAKLAYPINYLRNRPSSSINIRCRVTDKIIYKHPYIPSVL